MTTSPGPDLRNQPRTGTILTGVEALARLLVLRAQLDERDGLRTATMVSGYPGSPLGAFDLTLESLGPSLGEHRIHHRPGLNEELAISTVWGSQMGAALPYAEGVDGVAGAWYGKTPGLDRSGDALKHANAMGSGPNGGAVLFCGDDPSAKSSTLPCDSQHAFADACVPVLVPADQQDVVDLGVHAFRLSRWAGPWVGLKVVTGVADGIGTVDLDPARHHLGDPTGVEIAGRAWHHEPLRTIGPHQIPDQEILVVEHRLRAAQAYVRHHGLDRISGAAPGAALGIIVAGKTSVDLRQALADLGVGPDDLGRAGLRILTLAMTFPVVPGTVLDFAASVDEVLVLEEKRPFVEEQVRSILHESGATVPVRGKRDAAGDPLVPVVGELDTAIIRTVLERCRPDLRPARREPDRVLLPMVEVPGRAPGFCSGCPHNRSTVAPEGALVGGGVGCHGIMYFEARNAGMKRLPPTPMGSEGVPWIGLAPFVEEPHLIQNLGDGTLSHSGTLAIRAAVAAGADMTFKILYNSAVAMTGGQDVVGLLDVPAMTRALEAEGVARIVVCADDPGRYDRRARWAPGVDVLDRDELPAVQERLRDQPGVTVVIYDQVCAAEARRLRKRGELETPPRRVVINEAVCEGCGDCSTKSNCLSVLPVETELGTKRQIHDPSCNRDYTCLDGDCPSFVTITPLDPQDGSADPERRVPVIPPGDLPEPELPEVGSQYGVYFTGIGGTGVVTANRVLARAADAMGLVVEGMDQTGLSQKAGAVVSHLHFAPDRSTIGSASIGTEGADAYLSGDLLQAAAAHHLERVRPGRTVAVVDATVTPTAAMLQSGSPPPDVAALKAAIAARAGDDRTRFVDSQRIAAAVFADNLKANTVLLGAAFQMGALPIPLERLDAAMAEGRGGESNRNAFTWGRWAAHDPGAVERALDAVSGPGAPSAAAAAYEPTAAAARAAESLVHERTLPDALRGLLTRRAAQVVDYQDRRLAARYLDLVGDVGAVDDGEHELTGIVAQGWFRVLTYKDEYEVARLHRRVDYRAAARELGITGDVAVSYHLHPPALRRLGLRRKLPMGRPYDLAFAALVRMKRLRGTRLDVFGHDRDRKLERAVIEEYESLVRDIVLDATTDPDRRLRAAASVLEIRGYGPIKEAAVARWRAEVAELRGSR